MGKWALGNRKAPSGYSKHFMEFTFYFVGPLGLLQTLYGVHTILFFVSQLRLLQILYGVQIHILGGLFWLLQALYEVHIVNPDWRATHSHFYSLLTTSGNPQYWCNFNFNSIQVLYQSLKSLGHVCYSHWLL